LRALIPLSKIPFLTILGEVTVLETIQNETSLSPLLKWPNDVLINGKKIATFLAE
jgi:BirA family biotin operon repressor/biotin-[acetyl-CoA-carboxylase] ligase